MNPFDNPTAYGKIAFGPFPGPGSLVDVDGADRPYGWDKQKGTGTDGATNSYKGEDIADSIKTEHHLTTAADFVALAALRKGVTPAKGKKPIAFDVKNAHFNNNGINSIALKKFGQEKYKGAGLWSVTIEWTEDSPAKPTKTGPVDASRATGAASDIADSAPSEAEKQLADLLKKAQEA